ncbi:MAG TPA: sensor domain-containing diguanylate cyclase, partial [Bacillota bacterium]|nr:sensor domain-containing diguanylate cyclase [Bacillota bacterium]
MRDGYNIKKSRWLTAGSIGAVVCILIIVFSYYSYEKKLDENLKDYAYSKLDETVKDQAFVISSKIHDESRILVNIADYLAKEGTDTKKNLLMASMEKGSTFEAIGYSDKNGIITEPDGKQTDISKREYFEKAIKGEETTQYVEKSIEEGKPEIIIAVPVKDGSEIKGVVAGKFGTDQVEKALKTEDFGGKGYFCLCNSKGTVVAATKRKSCIFNNAENIFEKYENMQITGGDTIETVKEKIKAKKSGYIEFSYKNRSYYTRYVAKAPSWILLYTAPTEVIEENMSFMKKGTVELVIGLMIAMAVIFGALFYEQTRATRRYKQINHEMNNINESLDIALSQTPRMILDYDKKTDTAKVFKNYMDEKAYPIGHVFGEFSESDGFVYVEDKEIHKRIIKRTEQDERADDGYIQEYVRYTFDGGSTFIWCYVTGQRKLDEQGNIEGAIFVLEDVNVDKEELKNIEKKAETDLLTGLLNKKFTEKKVTELIGPKKTEGFLFMMDLDDFKRVNDEKGHAIGDIILEKTADAVRRSFREEDIKGRVGGDEFLVFMPGTTSGKGAADRANKIAEELKKISEYVPGTDITCSIGIASYPKDGRTFRELYEAVDKAMYHVKRHGKKGYSFTKG